MKKTTPPVQEQIDSLNKQIERSIAEWEAIKTHGCSDPFYTDGVNMNLVRNHIIYYKNEIARLQEADTEQLSLFSELICDCDPRPTPPKVPDSYMSPTGEHPNRLFNRFVSPYTKNS